MSGFEDSTILWAYIISNLSALLLVGMCWKRPALARLMLFALFSWASWTNWKTALHHPEFYLDYADFTFSGAYKQFILGWFSRHITAMVGTIATCQALIAIAMVLKGSVYKAALAGAIVFLLAIAPLGVGSAFPFSLTASVGLYLLCRKKTDLYLWEAIRRQEYRH